MTHQDFYIATVKAQRDEAIEMNAQLNARCNVLMEECASLKKELDALKAPAQAVESPHLARPSQTAG